MTQKRSRDVREELTNLSTLRSGDVVEIELVIESKNDYEYLLFEDRKAAGFEPIALRSGYNGNDLGAYMEFRDQTVCFFTRTLSRGLHSVRYRVRAEVPGKFSARSGLRRLLENEGFAAGDIDRVVGQYQQLNLAPTNDRSVLGSLNDLARIAEGQVAHLGGLGRCDLRAIDHEMNITPMSRLHMESPLTVTRRVLEGGDLAANSKGRPSPQRKKRPGRMDMDAVRIERQGDAAILAPRSRSGRGPLPGRSRARPDE